MSKKILTLSLLCLLTACSSWKPLKAPCTYNNRSGCGPIIPLQQDINSATSNNA